MTKLTARQESFIQLMTETEELARHGFTLLLKRKDFHEFFDALREAGLLRPDQNPGPQPGEKEGYFRIPYWSALDYLLAVAKVSGGDNDLALAEKVLEVIRSVSTWRDAEGHLRENYHTWRAFAEILGVIPTVVIGSNDLDLIPIWLDDKFDHGLVASALDKSVLGRFLASTISDDWKKAVAVLRHCTALKWVQSDYLGDKEGRPITVVNDFWLRELIAHHAQAFGAKTGKDAAGVFRERIRELFKSESRPLPSRFYRPAIEDHAQNHDTNAAENRMVEGLRDVLLDWSDGDPTNARIFVEELVADEASILRRVGIYIIGKKWERFNCIYPKLIGPNLFDPDHLHEIYNLLREHFADLDEMQMQATIEAISEIPMPEAVEDPQRSLKRIQQRWLSATVGKGYAPADNWFRELQTENKIPAAYEHPDFDAYIESGWGPGPSPYSVQEIIRFATEGSIVDKLNSFVQEDAWRGPTTEGLVSTFEDAVKTVPGLFLAQLPKYLKAKKRFQHGLMSALKRAWEDTDGKDTTVDWETGWSNLVGFFEELTIVSQYGNEEGLEDSGVTQDWIISAIADFLESGTKNDKRAYSDELLPRTWELIRKLLDQAQGIDRPSDDPMMQAINSPKGRAVEVLFSQALRICRASDRNEGSHTKAWMQVQPCFEDELKKCKNANYEFSTLCGAYLAQLDYMDKEWTTANISHIFPSDFPPNIICALGGLAYASFTVSVYMLVAESGALDRGLRYDLTGRGSREKLLERIGGAYLWGKEEMGSTRFSYLFEKGNETDLEVIARLFWSFRGSELSLDQKRRILEYWNRCIDWVRVPKDPPRALLSTLSTLSIYLSTIDERTTNLLKAVAPYVSAGHNTHIFVEQLTRLAELNPESVCDVLDKMLDAQTPDYDYEDRLKSLLIKLAEKGKEQDARLYANRLRSLPGMQELYNKLTRAH